MKRLFNIMLSGVLIISVSACGKQSGMAQSEQSENAKPLERTIISQTKDTTELATVTETTQEQEAHAMADDISFNFETKTVMLNSGYEVPIYGIGTYSLTGFKQRLERPQHRLQNRTARNDLRHGLSNVLTG